MHFYAAMADDLTTNQIYNVLDVEDDVVLVENRNDLKQHWLTGSINIT